ncbi:MAG: type II secretion system minor pseudopilin GspH [Proteobacteria bacterium]|nr:type II secretion system minor pseudopilin GspH [Pseudomonadota bacterium]
MTALQSRSRSSGFTLIEIMIVVVIIGVISAAVLLSVNLTGRDRDLEKESDRLLALVNYAREQAEMQTRDFGIVVHDDGYQFVAYDTRRQLWREVYEDDALHLRMLPAGLDFKLTVDARPVVLQATGEIKQDDPKDRQKVKTLADLKNVTDAAGLKEATGTRKMGADDNSSLAKAKKIEPQIMIYANGDLSSFQITLEREGGVRSVTLAQDDKGEVILEPMVETRT